MTSIIIEHGTALIDGDLIEAPIELGGPEITEIGRTGRNPALRINAGGLLVLPGIVDIHGDAFERQMMPRPGVSFPIDIALRDTDRQLVANGITTAFHGITWSWEPGLRGTENAHELVDAIQRLKLEFCADTRVHLRHETFNLSAEPVIIDWLKRGRIDLLAFNDHMSLTALDQTKPEKRARMAERTGMPSDEFDRLVERVASRRDEVPASIARLAAAANAAGIRTLSHDDWTPEQRRGFRALGIHIAEFPTNEETAREAAEAGEFTVFGAPNVVRGGSHTGWTSAAEMARKNLCRILASDYYYPAMLLAAFRLAHDGVTSLPKAWDMISQAPALAAGLTDRGQLAAGHRADVVLIDSLQPLRPRVVGAIANGRIVHFNEANRLAASPAALRPVVAA